MKSIVSDAWEVLDPNGNVVGELKEDSNGMMRRMMPSFMGMPMLPGRWHLTVNGQSAMHVQEQRKFLAKQFDVTLAPGVDDVRFAIGGALLALMKEVMREGR